MAFEIEDIDDVLQRVKGLHGVDLTAEQLKELIVEWLQLLSGPMQAVRDIDAATVTPWAVDFATGDVRDELTPDQRQARERLQRTAKETLQTLLDRYRS